MSDLALKLKQALANTTQKQVTKKSVEPKKKQTVLQKQQELVNAHKQKASPKTSQPAHNTQIKVTQKSKRKPKKLTVYNSSFETETPILAKDRHFIRQLHQRIKKAKQDKNTEKVEKLQQQLTSVQEKSEQAVKERIESIPVIQLNEELPVSGEAPKLIKAIQENQVIIVAGETGSGKTTQLPKIAMLAGRGVTGQIGHTQPRRLAARTVSERIASELGQPLGQTVSYKVRFNETGNKNSIVKLMTDGILLAELGNDRFLSNYDTIIIDEAHERSLNIDFILGYIKQLLPKRPDLKVIITSATLDVKRFSEYFTYDVRTQEGRKTVTAPVFSVEGRSYPVDVIYQPVVDYTGTNNYINDADAKEKEYEENIAGAVTKAVDTCFDIAVKNKHQSQADILIFASTEREIRELAEILTKQCVQNRHWHSEVLMLFARQTLAEQQRIFSSDNRKTSRRIIISTNVAETAVTVPNIRFVIDLGKARMSRYSYRSRVQRLPIENISQAAANQRKGRCGRIAAGTCIRLYDEMDFLNRPEFTEPEIKRTNLASVILQMANLRLGNVEDFDFIEPPDYRLVNDGKKLLVELGAFATVKKSDSTNKINNRTSNKNSYAPTPLSRVGKQMANMPIDPRLARILIAGHQCDCLTEILIIVSALSIQDIRERPAEKAQQADQKHALFRQDDSDFLFYTALWNTLNDPDDPLSNNQKRSFAKKHYLSVMRMREWEKTHEQLVQLTKQLKLSQNKDEATYQAIHKALLSGLLSNIAQKGDWGSYGKDGRVEGKDERGEYLAAKNKKVRIFPSSTLYRQKTDWVMAFEVVETTQVYLRCSAKIEPEWLVDLGNDLLKYHYFEPHWSKKTGRVQAYAQISLYGLTVITKQKCNFEQVDLEASHEIFLRDALTTGNVGIQAPFLSHNLNKLAHVALMEDKLRRKDLLVDEEDIYQFYARKVPSNIASRHAFEFWRKGVEKSEPKLLFFQDSDILAGDTNALDSEQFPHNLTLGDMKLPLKYVFDPSSDKDGVTVRVPKIALPQLDTVALTWGIPAWRNELVTSLLKSLPKAHRKQIVPIPNTVAKLIPLLNIQSTVGLLTQMCHYLNRMGVTGIQTSDFALDNIPEFLRPRVEVLDNKKRVIDASRDIADLQLKHKPEFATATLTQGMHTSFPDFFKFENNRTQAGVKLCEYHALKPAKDGVSVTMVTVNDELLAKQIHLQGVIALLKASSVNKHKQIKKLINKNLLLAFAPLGNKEQLESMIIHASCAKTVHDSLGVKTKTSIKGLPLSQADYEKLEQEWSANLLSHANQIYIVVQNIFTAWQKIRQQLLMLNSDIFADSIEDIEDQLDGLQFDTFIQTYTFNEWQEYPRYLQALQARLDKLSNNLPADVDGVAELDLHMERIHGVNENHEFNDYKWLVEEYRISLFAQPMKTKQPVSAKRLEKLWEKLTRQNV